MINFVFQQGFEVATVYSVEEDNNVVRKGMTLCVDLSFFTSLMIETENKLCLLWISDIRDNWRVLEQFPALAKVLFDLVKPHLPPVVGVFNFCVFFCIFCFFTSVFIIYLSKKKEKYLICEYLIFFFCTVSRRKECCRVLSPLSLLSLLCWKQLRSTRRSHRFSLISNLTFFHLSFVFLRECEKKWCLTFVIVFVCV